MSLLRTIEKFLEREGMSPSRFGRAAARDPRFVHDLRLGREPRAATEQRIRAFIAEREEPRR